MKLNEVEEEYRTGKMALLITPWKFSGILSYIVLSSTRRAD